MEQISTFLSGPLDNIARAGAPKWVMLVLALVMFGGWTGTYLAIIRESSRDKTYGIPIPNTCLNFSWEFIFSFNLAGGLPAFFFPLQVGHVLWLGPNLINVIQTLRYGPDIQKYPWVRVRKHFYGLFALTFVIGFAIIYTYHGYARDIFGVASSWIINVLMSALFIRMFLDRRNEIAPDGSIRGMSLSAAWFKLIGNAAGAVFCFFWWPAQFSNGVLVWAGVTVPEPPSYAFLYVIYSLNLLLDALLIHLVRQRERELRSRRSLGVQLPASV